MGAWTSSREHAPGQRLLAVGIGRLSYGSGKKQNDFDGHKLYWSGSSSCAQRCFDALSACAYPNAKWPENIAAFKRLNRTKIHRPRLCNAKSGARSAPDRQAHISMRQCRRRRGLAFSIEAQFSNDAQKRQRGKNDAAPYQIVRTQTCDEPACQRRTQCDTQVRE